MRFDMKKSYYEDIRLFRHRSDFLQYLALIVGLFLFPIIIGDFFLCQFTFIFIYSIAAIGLMLLTGYTGQLSLGHAAFFAIGSYTTAIMTNSGVPFPLALLCAGLLAGFASVFVALPALRVAGLYLAIVTLGFAYIVQEILIRWESVTQGNMGITLASPNIGPLVIESETEYYYFTLILLILTVVAAKNILRSPTGRALIAIRDSEVAAQAIGVSLLKFKTIAFAVSAFLTGIAGAVYAHKLTFISPESYNIKESVLLLAMIIIGGLGSLHGAILGAAFLLFLDPLIITVKDYLPDSIPGSTGIEPVAYGMIIILFILFEPAGIYGRWIKIKTYFEMFPLYKKDTFKRVISYFTDERH